MATRNRVIYQSEAVYCTQNISFSGSNVGPYATKDLNRVQSANYSFNIGRTDVNQFGQLGAIDRIITESPTVSFDSSYLLANFANEARLGFFVTPSGQNGPFRSCIAPIIDSTDNAYMKNYYILQAKEGKDADVETSGTTSTSGQYESIIGIGNAGLTSYAVEAAVGGFPSVSFAAEGLNMNFNKVTNVKDSGTAHPFYIFGVNPAIDPVNGIGITSGNATNIVNSTVSLPTPTGNAGGTTAATKAAGSVSVLRPGDIKLFLSKQTSQAVDTAALSTSMDSPAYAGASITAAHIQSFNISFDMSRSSIEQLGNKFAYARLIDFPISLSMGIDAVVADLTTGSLAEIINCDDTFDARIALYSPDCVAYDVDKTAVAANYIVKGIKLDSQSFSLGIGDNKTVSLSFSTQIGGPEQSGLGLFMSGYTGIL